MGGINFLEWLNVSLTGSVLLIHVFCLLILWRYDKPKKQCFIITLLMSELFVSILQLSRFANDHISGNTEIAYYIINISAYTLNIPYCGGLILLTLERYMEISLHIKYYTSFFYVNRLKLCTGLWIIDAGITCYSLTSILKKTSPPPLSYIFQINLYFLYVAHGVILILFTAVYAYIYKLFRRSVKQQQKQQRRSSTTALKTSRIFAPFLIVLTFICFMTVPMMLYIYVFPESDQSWVLLFNRANSITDGLLYVLFNPRIRKKLLKRKYTNTSYQTTVNDSTHVASNKTSSSQQMDSNV